MSLTQIAASIGRGPDMVALGAVFDAHLRVAAGEGRLLRRAGACLYIPAPLTAAAGDLIGHVVGTTDDLIAAVGDFVLEHGETPPFVLVTWPTATTSNALHLLVRGDTAVETDLASVPELSGAGAATWAEHLVRRQPDQASIRSGAPTQSNTALTDGIVPAGGFSLHLVASSTQAPPAAPTADTATADTATADTATATPQAVPAPTPSHPGDLAPGSEPNLDPGRLGLVALRLASGAPAPDETPRAPLTRPAIPPAVEPTSASTDAPQTPPAPATPHDDPETTVIPGDLDIEPPSPAHRLLQAAMCEHGHANPPHRATCRVCGAALTSDQTTTVEQPVLAIAQLPSGDSIPIDSTIVVGRNPSAEAARVDADHQLIALDAPSSVSRTHLVISVDGWTITATDCGSQGGSALVPDDAEEPIELIAWIPHELNRGDTLYLGGPTFVRILDVPN